MKNIVILISGRGGNMQAIVNADIPNANITAVLSNNETIAGLAWAAECGIATDSLSHKNFDSCLALDQAMMERINAYQPDLVVLTGFMCILTLGFCAHYKNCLISIYLSTLPSFTGLHTHERALEVGCRATGYTIHFVTPELDRSPIISQGVVPTLNGDTADDAAACVLTVEHRLFPQAVVDFVAGRLRIEGSRVLNAQRNVAGQNLLVWSKRHIHKENIMNPIKTTSLTLSLLTVSVGAQAAELPQSAVSQYSGSCGTPATTTFTRSGNQYKIVPTVKVPFYNIRFEFGGSINGTTLNPSYYKDVYGGKVYAEARFSGDNITHGKAGDSKTEKSGSAMDLLILAWQLAADDVRLSSGLKITNGRKLYTVGSMNKIGNEGYEPNGGTTPMSKYRVRRGDDTVTYSFASDIDNIPTRISYTDDGKTYDLKLTSVKINGKVVEP